VTLEGWLIRCATVRLAVEFASLHAPATLKSAPRGWVAIAE